MPIFIIKNNPGLKLPLELSKEDEHHLLKVMRIRCGEVVWLTDNQGLKACATVQETKPLTFAVTSQELVPKPGAITACLPLIDQKRMEWAVEKLTELNVETIQLMHTNRCQQKDLSKDKIERLNKISVTAQKQCERCWPLTILEPIPLKEMTFEKDRNYFFGHKPTPVLSERSESKEPTIFIGPEGGFTDEEIAFLTKNNAQAISLGSTVLRAETAALALAITLKYL